MSVSMDFVCIRWTKLSKEFEFEGGLRESLVRIEIYKTEIKHIRQITLCDDIHRNDTEELDRSKVSYHYF